MNNVLKALGQVLATKATKSVTAWIGAAVVAGGGAEVLDPELVSKVLALVPPQYQHAAVVLVGAAVVLARHRRDFAAQFAALKTEADAESAKIAPK